MTAFSEKTLQRKIDMATGVLERLTHLNSRLEQGAKIWPGEYIHDSNIETIRGALTQNWIDGPLRRDLGDALRRYEALQQIPEQVRAETWAASQANKELT